MLFAELAVEVQGWLSTLDWVQRMEYLGVVVLSKLEEDCGKLNPWSEE